MSTFDGLSDDVEIHEETVIEIDMVQLAIAVRAQLLKDARRTGNLFGPTAAQKKTPLASKATPPQNRRVW